MHEKPTIPRVCQGCGDSFLARKSRVKAGQALFCSMGCRYPGTYEDRFWAKVNKDGPVIRSELGACWEWTGSKSDRGYGNVWMGERLIRAPRVAYELTYGPMPEGTEPCHKCDYPPCCQPNHIFPGTHAENMKDMVEKGRMTPAKGMRNGAYTKPEQVRRGTSHGNAKLTDDDIREIRRLFAADNVNLGDLARQFRTTRTNIGYIVRCETWAHVV